MNPLDLIVYCGLAVAAAYPLVPLLVSRLLFRTTVTVDEEDWRQPWVARLMDLQGLLDEHENKKASETCRLLAMEIISNGPTVKAS